MTFSSFGLSRRQTEKGFGKQENGHQNEESPNFSLFENGCSLRLNPRNM